MTRFCHMLLPWLRVVGVWTLVASCALFLWSADDPLAHAEPPESAAEINLFLDLDKDGGMSYEEFVQSLDAKSMEALDSDRDGFLSEEEVRGQNSSAQNPSSILFRFSEIDTDGDKQLSAKELEAATRKSPRVRMLYDTLDVDHNNQLSPAELRNPSPGVGLLRIEF